MLVQTKMSLLSEVWRWRKYLRHPVTRSVTALQYFWPLAFCNRVAPGRRPVCQPRRHAWLWLLAALLLGLPERRGLLSPGRFHQPVAPSQPRLPLWTGGPRRHQWTVRLWLWGPIAGFGGQLDGEGGEELVGFPCLGRFLFSLGGGASKGGLEINVLWTDLWQKPRRCVAGCGENVLRRNWLSFLKCFFQNLKIVPEIVQHTISTSLWPSKHLRPRL